MYINLRQSKTISIPFGITITELIAQLKEIEGDVGYEYTLRSSWREGNESLGIRFSKDEK